jgi:hypothetical protein
MVLSEISNILKQSAVEVDDKKLHSLTKIHSIVSGKRSKCPYVWLKTKQAQECIQVLESQLKDSVERVVHTNYRRSTLAHATIATLYLMWLDTSKMVLLVQTHLEEV